MRATANAISSIKDYPLGADALHRRIGDAVEVALVDAVVVQFTADREQATVDRLATLARRPAGEQIVAFRNEPIRGLVQAGDREA